MPYEQAVFLRIDTADSQPYLEGASSAELVVSTLFSGRDKGWFELVGFVVLLDPARKRVKPAIWRSESSTVCAAVASSVSRERTTTLAGVSLSFASSRVIEMVTSSETAAGWRTIVKSKTPSAANARSNGAKPIAWTRSRARSVMVPERVKRPSLSVVVRTVVELMSVTSAFGIAALVLSTTTPVIVCADAMV